jgi:phytoene dehydrogenase-like protein
MLEKGGHMKNVNGHTIVIGSGPGGAGAAALLQSRGHQVTLLERNDFTGGKCHSFEKDGFLVDSGVHMFSRGPGGPHSQLDGMVRGDLGWLVKDPGTCGYVENKRIVSLYQRLLSKPNLKEWAGAYRDGTIRPPLLHAFRHAVRESGMRGLLDIARRTARRDPAFFRELDGISAREFLLKLTDFPAFLRVANALSMLMLVLPYDRASAGEYLWCAVNIFGDKSLGVPRGGSNEIPDSFLRALRRDGGELRTGCEVRRIRVDGGKVTGVETGEGEFIPASTVVSSAGIKRTVEMAGEEQFPGEYVERVRSLEDSYSFITVKYGLASRVVDSPSAGFFNIPFMDPDAMFGYLEDGSAPEDPFLFTPLLTEWDPGAAPPGRQLVIMGVPGPSGVNPASLEHCGRILDRAEERFFELFPRAEREVLWSMRTDVSHTAAITGKDTGECIGIAQCVGQTGDLKPAPRTPVEGLWLVGADAGARGVGTEQASASAICVAGLLAGDSR